MYMMECPDCGKEISTRAKICQNCGCEITKKMIEEYEKNFRETTKYHKKVRDIEKEWEEFGHSGRTLKIKNLSLSQDEIEELFHQNVLSQNIYSIFNVGEFVYESDVINSITENIQRSNILMIFEVSFNEFLFFTKDFLIICGKKNYYNPNRYEINMKYPLVIPCYKISKFEILNGNNVVMKFDPEYAIKKGDVAKGAMIGAMVGGTTGAIIGATANLPKKVMVSPTKFYNVDFLQVKITFKNSTNSLTFKLFGFNKADCKFLDDTASSSKMVREINNILLNTNHSSTKLNSIDEVTEICSEYVERCKEICHNAINYAKRKKCIDYIYAEIDDKIKINPYCDNKSFIMWINDILNNSQNNKYSEIKQEIKEMLNKIKKQNSEKIKIMDNILKLKNNYTTLSIFNFSQKKKLKEQISQLEQQLQELSFDDYPDITENLYKYFN